MRDRTVDTRDDRSYISFTMKTKDDKKTALLEAGTAAMLRKGYHGTGIQEIVDAAGVPKGSFYNYFKSKEAFVIAAMEFTSRSNMAAFEQALQDNAVAPEQRIINAFQDMTDRYMRERAYTQGCFVGNMCQEMAETNMAVAEKAEYLFRNYTAALARCIREYQDAKGGKNGPDADRLAEFIFNSWEGAILRMKSSRNAQPLHAFMDTITTILN